MLAGMIRARLGEGQRLRSKKVAPAAEYWLASAGAGHTRYDIAGKAPPLTDGASALRVLRVLQAAQRSLITQGQAVSLPME